MIVCLPQVCSVQRRCLHLRTALPDSGKTKNMAGVIGRSDPTNRRQLLSNNTHN